MHYLLLKLQCSAPKSARKDEHVTTKACDTNSILFKPYLAIFVHVVMHDRPKLLSLILDIIANVEVPVRVSLPAECTIPRSPTNQQKRPIRRNMQVAKKLQRLSHSQTAQLC